MSPNKSAADFMVRVAARFLKDPAISADAKALRAVLGAYADGRTGRTYVLPSTRASARLEPLSPRARAARTGALRMAAPRVEARSPGALGAAHLFFVLATVARIHHSGEIEQLIIDHVLRRGKSSALVSQVKVIKDHEPCRGERTFAA